MSTQTDGDTDLSDTLTIYPDKPSEIYTWRAPSLPTKAEIDEKPWRYIGYDGLATYMSADSDCFVLRRFDKLFTRGILSHQDRLSELEEKLETLDSNYREVQPDGREINNGTIRDDVPDRKALVGEIRRELKEYYKSISLYSDLKSRPLARQRYTRNLRTWLYNNHPGAIAPEETTFITHDEDLIPIITKDQTKIRQLFDDWLTSRPSLIAPLFQRHPSSTSSSSSRSDPGPAEIDAGTVYYTSDRHVDILSSVAIFITGSVMFIAPLWVLQALKEFRLRLAVITVFILVFLTVLASSTLGRPGEVLAATAGYSAVLVVFLQFGVSQD